MSRTNGSTQLRVGNGEVASLIRNQNFVINELISRAALIKAQQQIGQKNIDKECGYPDTIGPEEYWDMYRRNGLARKVVDFFPNECWALSPEVYETEDQKDTPFELAWQEFVEQTNCFFYLQRADRLSGIGQYGVMLLGLDDGKDLSAPIAGVDDKKGIINPTKRKHQLLFMRVIPEALLQIQQWEASITSKRYGQPLYYTVKFGDPEDPHTLTSAAIDSAKKVHWSRIIHFADNRISSEIFGSPRQEPVYNYLLDVKKTLGGSAEMFWKGGFPGISFEMDPTVAASINAMTPDEQDKIKKGMRKEFDDYQQGLQRYLALIGVKANSLNPQVADPSMQFEAQITAICITLGVPKRIFMGSERGELASGQDSEHWNKKVKARQKEYMTPFLVRPFLDRLIALGVLPTPKKIYVNWPDVNTPSEQDIAVIGTQVTNSLKNYVTGQVAKLIPPLEYFTTVLKWPLPVAQAVEKAMKQKMKEVSKQGLAKTPEQEIQMVKATAQAKAAGKPTAAGSRSFPARGTKVPAKSKTGARTSKRKV